MKKESEFNCLFGHNIISNGLFHKNITKVVFLWPNMGQKCFKVLCLIPKITKNFHKNLNTIYLFYDQLQIVKLFVALSILKLL